MREPTNPPYLLQLILPLAPEITELSWRTAWQRVVSTHPILRLGYAAGTPWIARQEEKPEWVSENMSHLLPAAYYEKADQKFKHERQAGFDFSKTPALPLCRCFWTRPPTGEVPLWCLTIHHALIDGNSFAPLISQILHVLENSDSLPSEPSFLERAKLINSTNWKDAREFFQRTHAPTTPATDPREHLPRNLNRSSSSGNVHRVSLKMDPELRQQLNAQRKIRPSTLVHAAWSLVLSRVMNSKRVEFGVTRHCRGKRNEGLRDAIGPFSNVLPLCTEVPEDKSVTDWLMDIHNAWQSLEPFENCPLQEILQPEGQGQHENRSLKTLVNIVGNTLATEIEHVLGKHAAQHPQFHQKTDLPLSLVINIQPELTGYLVAQTDYFSLQQTEMFARLFVQALREIISHSLNPVSELSLVLPSDLLHSRGCDIKHSANTVLTLLLNVISKHGNAIAVSTPTQSLNFTQLWKRASTFASELNSHGVQPEDVVAILTGRSIETIVAMIGSLHAGATFFIVNEDLAQERQVENILSANSRYLVLLPDMDKFDDQISHIKRIYPSQEEPKTTYEIGHPQANNLAYLVATSGTTGSPNIVMIEHGSLANLVQGYAMALHPSIGDVRYQSVSASSDTFVLEVMLYLSYGASLHIEPGLLKGGFGKFDQALQQHGISIIGLPSSLWREWAGQQDNLTQHQQSTIRAVICSMERTDPDALRTWREQNGRNLLWINAYGPSEATCVASLFPIQIGETTPRGEVPIGRPLPNVQIYVIDSMHRSRPMGIIGEIAIGGAGVARGYANNPRKNKSKFVTDPFTTHVKTQLYLTGDLGYFQEDGNIIFVGRSDNQVKIRGHRIELEEVELTLSRHPLVMDAAAVAVPHGHSHQLTAFYTSDSDPNIRSLRVHLLAHLSATSTPHRFIQRDVIPRDRLGKVNRQQLTQEAAELIATKSLSNDILFEWKESEPLQIRLSSLFGHVLDIQNFEVQDDFFLCGGDSLSSVVLLTEIKKNSGHTLSINDLFQHPTPSSLAKHLEGHSKASQCLVPLSSGGEQPPLLFFHGYHGDLFTYLPLTKALGEDRPVWGLQAKENLGVPYDGTIEAMASRYATEIISKFATTPCYLCGYSLGGLIALETARQLIKQGFPVKRLLIIDTFPANLPVATQIKMRTLYLRQRIKKTLRKHRKMINYTCSRFSKLQNLLPTKCNLPFKVQRKKSERLLSSYCYEGLALKYQPEPLPADVSFFMSKGGIRDLSSGWQYLSNKRLRVVMLPWQHHDIMQEKKLDDLAALFRVELKR